ncbi:phosphate ABC transporter substrate-binding protein [Allocoprobacillus halotolerans]|uniref:Phosphate-binding protein n=1 Tax=Allocoprobacillus halotolerans TaxID=2944914 RepID=A0ABY5I6Q3_9FIRM|nr:phosphate ABC transporter substrate-binding protein [Allocoprobacillus halotolerans]UTY39901.1 phosphate ABC transporter substrate-binding protein [Allocoprobacillus halotolerans]
MKKFGILIGIVLVCLCFSSFLVNADIETKKISLNGSTSMEKMINALKEGMDDQYPELLIEPQFTGSSAGIEAVFSGTAQIGNSSRYLKDTEKEKGLIENIVAIDAIVIVTDKHNQVNNLTTQQLIDIYKGKIRNWKEVGGQDLPIVVIGRESGSGTRSAFEEILELEEQCQYANEVNESGPIIAKAQSIPGAIGYVSLDVVDESVKTLAINGVKANETTIQNGQYSLQRPFVMATQGEISKQNEEVQKLFQFIASEDGQKIIRAVGLVPTTNEMSY